MKLATRHDVEAPIDAVFRELTDFAQMERMAMRRGYEIARLAEADGASVGMAWRIGFHYRNHPVEIGVRLTGHDPGNALDYGFEAEGFDGRLRIEVMALSPRRTRMMLESEVLPRKMMTRLLFGSAWLVKGQIQERLDAAARRLAGMIEERCRASG